VSMKLTMNPRDHGQGLVEYALIMVFVALAVIAMLSFFGTSVGNLYSTVITSI
jgi:Flp pilus assembly pilin Flp